MVQPTPTPSHAADAPTTTDQPTKPPPQAADEPPTSTTLILIGSVPVLVRNQRTTPSTPKLQLGLPNLAPPETTISALPLKKRSAPWRNLSIKEPTQPVTLTTHHQTSTSRSQHDEETHGWTTVRRKKKSLSRRLQHGKRPERSDLATFYARSTASNSCFRCGKAGHLRAWCKNQVTCARCGISGHLAKRAPPKVSLLTSFTFAVPLPIVVRGIIVCDACCSRKMVLYLLYWELLLLYSLRLPRLLFPNLCFPKPKTYCLPP